MILKFIYLFFRLTYDPWTGWDELFKCTLLVWIFNFSVNFFLHRWENKKRKMKETVSVCCFHSPQNRSWVKFPHSPILHYASSSWIEKTMTKKYISTRKTDLFYCSMELCGNFTVLFFVYHLEADLKIIFHISDAITMYNFWKELPRVILPSDP